jgi:hypothetical protein
MWADAHGFTDEFLARVASEPRSMVTFEIVPLGQLVKLSVVHGDFEPGSTVLESVTRGWPIIPSRLKTLRETGGILSSSPRVAHAGSFAGKASGTA